MDNFLDLVGTGILILCFLGGIALITYAAAPKK